MKGVLTAKRRLSLCACMLVVFLVGQAYADTDPAICVRKADGYPPEYTFRYDMPSQSARMKDINKQLSSFTGVSLIGIPKGDIITIQFNADVDSGLFGDRYSDSSGRQDERCKLVARALADDYSSKQGMKFAPAPN